MNINFFEPVKTRYKTVPCWICDKCNYKHLSKTEECKKLLFTETLYDNIITTFATHLNITLTREQILTDNFRFPELDKKIIDYFEANDASFLEMGGDYFELPYLELIQRYLNGLGVDVPFEKQHRCDSTVFTESTTETSEVSGGITLSIGGQTIDRYDSELEQMWKELTTSNRQPGSC